MNGTFSPSEDTEFRRRDDALRAAVRAAGLTQLVVTDTDNIFYLSGASFESLERPFFLIFDVEGGRKLVVPTLERDHLHKGWGGAAQVATYREYPAPAGASWKDVLLNSGYLVSGFGFQDSTSFEIASVLKDAGGVPCDLLGPLRMVKSELEIRWIQRAAQYADWGVLNVLKSAHEGALVAQTFAVGQQLTRRIIRETPDWDPVTTKVICGAWPAPLSAMPHAIPALDMQLNGGPHVAMVLTRVQGYAAESERTFFTRPPSADEKARFELMLAARELALSRVRPGVACAEIDRAVNEFVGAREFSAFSTRLHRCGHGFGLGNHEPPWIADGSEHVLEENMLISIEPGLYVAGTGGYRHSDTVLVTSSGYRLLTKVPTAIDDLIVPPRKLRQTVQGYFVKRALGLN